MYCAVQGPMPRSVHRLATKSSRFWPELKSIDFAWGLGVGYQFAQGFGVNGRYNFGLSNLPEEDGKFRNGVFQVGVFYVFGGK